MQEPKFKKGDKVVFTPIRGNYTTVERNLRGRIAIVKDCDKVPTIEFSGPINLQGTTAITKYVTAALEADLVLA